MSTPEPETSQTVADRALPGIGGMGERSDLAIGAIPGPAGLAADAESRPPVVCDMTSAPDTAAQRLAEYGRLFKTAYLGRDRDQAGARWRLRADPGVEEWARDLADRENACCAFMTNTVTRQGDLVIWTMTTIDDEAANAALDMFHDLPLHSWTTPSEVEAALDRWSATGVPVIVREADRAPGHG